MRHIPTCEDCPLIIGSRPGDVCRASLGKGIPCVTGGRVDPGEEEFVNVPGPLCPVPGMSDDELAQLKKAN